MKLHPALLTFVLMVASPPVADSLSAKSPAGEPGRGRTASFARGVVVAHWLGGVSPIYTGQSNVPHVYAAPWFDDADVAWIAERGFDHLQIRVDAAELLAGDGSGSLHEERIAPLLATIEKASARGLGVVLLFEVAGEPEAVARDWERIARRLASVGDSLRFLVGAATDPAPIVSAIRRGDPRRFAWVEAPTVSDPGTERVAEWNGTPRALERLKLSGFDTRVGIAFGYWEPEVFSYAHREQPIQVAFPGTVPDMRALPEFFGYHDQK